MANTFITPTLIAKRALATLYNTIVLAELVWRDFDADFTNAQGDTVTVRKPAVFTAEEYNQSTGVTVQDATEGSTSITLDKIANVSFLVTDKQMALNIEDFQGQLLTPAAEAIAQKIDGDIAEALVDAAEGAGGGGTVSMGLGKGNDVFRYARRNLTRNKLPASERYSVLSPEGATVALGDDLLIAADKSGSTDALREAILGRLLGLETYESQVFGVGPGDRGQADGIAFHRSAVVLAVRQLGTPKGVADGQATVQNYKSISLRTVYEYNLKFKQDEVSVDVLYGVKATRPEGAVQLDMGQGS